MAMACTCLLHVESSSHDNGLGKPLQDMPSAWSPAASTGDPEGAPGSGQFYHFLYHDHCCYIGMASEQALFLSF